MSLFAQKFGYINSVEIVQVMPEYIKAQNDYQTLQKQYADEYERLGREYVRYRREGKWFNFFHFMVDLTGGPCLKKRLTGCGSGNEYVAVTADGDIYPCHQFVGVDEWKMGNLFDGTFNEDIKNTFAGTHVYSKQGCRDCWAKLYCSGGCAANAYHATGDITGVYEYGCELFRKRMECAIMIKAAEAE